MSTTDLKKDVKFKSDRTTSGTKIEEKDDTPTLNKERRPCSKCNKSKRSSSPPKDKLRSPDSQGKSKPTPCSSTFKPNPECPAMRDASLERNVSCRKSSGSATYIKPEQKCAAMRPASADPRICNAAKALSKIPCSKPTCSKSTGTAKDPCACRSKSPNSANAQQTTDNRKPSCLTSCAKNLIGKVSYVKPETSQPQPKQKCNTQTCMKQENANYYSNQYGSVTYIKPQPPCSQPYGAVTYIKPESKQPPCSQPYGAVTCIKPESRKIPCRCRKNEVNVLYEKDKARTCYTRPKETSKQYIDIQENMRQIAERKLKKGCICIKTDGPRPSDVTFSQNASEKTVCSGPCPSKSVAFSTTSVPISLRFKRSAKDTSTRSAKGTSRKSVCQCVDAYRSPSLKNMSSSKQIVLPEVKIEIGPERLQTIQIDVKPTDLDSSSSGIITIPVQLRFRSCCQKDEETMSAKAEAERQKVLKLPRKEKLLFEACVNRETFENYMEALAEELPEIRRQSIRELRKANRESLDESNQGKSNQGKSSQGKSNQEKSYSKETLQQPVTTTASCQSCNLPDKTQSKSQVPPNTMSTEKLKTKDSKSQVSSTEKLKTKDSKSQVSSTEKLKTKDSKSEEPSSSMRRKILKTEDSKQQETSGSMRTKVLKIDDAAPQELSSPMSTEELETEDEQLEETEVEEPETPKTEIIGLKETPWYEALENENYIESYLVEGYCAATDNVGIQTDLTLGEKLLSVSLNSLNEEKPIVPGCKCGARDVKASETIKWDQFILQPEVLSDKRRIPVVTIVDEKSSDENISAPPPKMFSLSPEPESETELPSLEDLPEKYSFVFRQDCANNYEPYLQALLREIRRKEVESPCSSKPKLPWTQLLLPDPKKSQIRKIVKLKKPKPRCSKSVPCFCGKTHDQVKPPENKSYSCANVRNASNKSGALNTCSAKLMAEKTNPTLNKKFMIKARFASLSQHGKMSTKVTFKMNKNKSPCYQSDTRDYQRDISPVNSKVVTCRYLNRGLKLSPENSRPDLRSELTNSTSYLDCPQNRKSCQLNTCEYKKPKFSLKPDPVVAAFRACEAELKPMREALSVVHQKLKNLNMPELDCMLRKNDFDDIPPVTKPCRCRNMRQKTPPSSPLNTSRSRFSYNNYNVPQSNSYQNYNQRPLSPKSLTCGCQPLKRNIAIQKTGSMYRTNVRKRKCAAFSSDDSTTTDTTRYTPSEDYNAPCQPKSSKSPSRRHKDKQRRSQISMARLTDSMCPFIEAIKSILTMDNTNTKVTKCARGRNISYESNLMTKQKKKMRVHMRIRPSTKS